NEDIKKDNIDTYSETSSLLPIFIIIYSISVLFIDLLITFDTTFIFSWGVLNFSLSDVLLKFPILKHSTYITIFDGFDLYKFIFWLILPFILFNRFIDFKWFSLKYWQKQDYLLFLFFCFLCLLSLIFVILSPTLRMFYPGAGVIPLSQKIQFFLQRFFWVISWLPGWEFLNRHLLLRACRQLSKGSGWFFVTITETIYHIFKPMLEILGMFIFSVVACIWSQKKENNLMAFFCHFIIEIGLIFLLLIT
ncbi:MAG: hypothetical protein ACP5KS_06685, partial [Candidatus Hydrogenedens sp.]